MVRLINGEDPMTRSRRSQRFDRFSEIAQRLSQHLGRGNVAIVLAVTAAYFVGFASSAPEKKEISADRIVAEEIVLRSPHGETRLTIAEDGALHIESSGVVLRSPGEPFSESFVTLSVPTIRSKEVKVESDTRAGTAVSIGTLANVAFVTLDSGAAGVTLSATSLVPEIGPLAVVAIGAEESTLRVAADSERAFVAHSSEQNGEWRELLLSGKPLPNFDAPEQSETPGEDPGKK